MLSYQIVEFGKPLERRAYPVPTPRGNEVLVRVGACGVCHSDLHLWSGAYGLGGGKQISLTDRGARLPFTMGHEIVGEIVAVGPDADAAAIGRQGVIFPWIGCGECAFCLRGRELMCETPRNLGTRRDGGYSDHVLVPDARYVVDFGGLDPHYAATTACSGLTAYSAIRKTPKLDADDTVVVIGAGGVGLAAIGLLARVTAAHTVAVDLSAPKRDAALEAGAAAAFDPTLPGALAQIRARGPITPRAVLDFVGTEQTASLALAIIGRGGCVVVVGLYGGEIPVSVSTMAMRNVTLQGSNVGTLEELHELIGILDTGGTRPIPVHARPMAEVNDALEELSRGITVGRTVLVPPAPEQAGPLPYRKSDI
jgi:D-arabinose 1-dehydrogenase-like Zn-dependent alcohol dehydrogenase